MTSAGGLRALYVIALIAGSLGCLLGPAPDPVEETELDGEVRASDFVVRAATAIHTGDGYVVTLADVTEMACDARDGLPQDFRQVRIGAFDGPGTYDAVGLVAFDQFEGGVSEDEPAQRGTVTIDSVGFTTIYGSIDARGASSEVFGDFTAEICYF